MFQIIYLILMQVKRDNKESSQSSSPVQKPSSWSSVANPKAYSRTDKPEGSMPRDPVGCMCACDEISKLKEKAHNSFMQVIQIQNLYKEEIQQLKEHYRQRERNQDKQHRCKEDALKEKCQRLETELQKIKLESSQEADLDPFTVENIDTITCRIQDQSYQSSIYNIKELINKQSLQEKAVSMEKQLKKYLKQIEQKANSQQELLEILSFLKSVASRTFMFIREMREEILISYEKYNQSVKKTFQLQNRLCKISLTNESYQKDVKFLNDQVKKISSQKLKLEQKYNQMERQKKGIEEYVKFLKNSVREKDNSLQQKKEKPENKDKKAIIGQNAEIHTCLQSEPHVIFSSANQGGRNLSLNRSDKQKKFAKFTANTSIKK